MFIKNQWLINNCVINTYVLYACKIVNIWKPNWSMNEHYLEKLLMRNI